MAQYSSFILMLSVAYARRSPVAGPETSRRAHRGIGGVTLCSRARLREGVCFDEDAASRDGGRRDGVATTTRARASRRAAARIDALVSDALFLADFLTSHIAPEVAEESLDHLRATINAQKRRLRRCRSGGTVDEDALVKETLRDHPPEERGTRAEWARRTGWHRREDTRRRAV